MDFSLEDVQREKGDAPAAFEQAAGEFEITFLAGDAVQLDQGQLDLLVPVGVGGRGVHEVAHQQVRSAADEGQQARFSCRGMVRDAGFDEMTEAVQFVLDLQDPPSAGRGSGSGCRCRGSRLASELLQAGK